MHAFSRTLTGVAIALSACLSLPLHATDGLLQIGYGSKSKGMGGVGVALAQDSFASAMNPAGLTMLCCRADAGIHARLSDIHTENSYGYSDDRISAISNEWNYWPEVGVVWGPFCDQVYGLAFYTVGEAEVRYRGDWLLQTKRSTSDNRILNNTRSDFSIYSVTPSWAWQINCVHSVGLALNATFARLKLDGLKQEGLEYQSTDKDHFSGRGGNWREGVSLRFGWTAQFMECLRLGVTYQTKTYMGHFKKYAGFLPDGGNADLPGQFGFGLAYTPTCDLIFAADVIKVFWRDGKWFRDDYFIPATSSTVEFGTNGGPGLGWNQQLLVKLGVAWCFNDCLTLRGGFVYGNSPVVAGNPLNSLLPETVNQHFTMGVTYLWCGCNEFSFEYVHGRSHKVSGPLSPTPDDELVFGSWRQWQRSFGFSWGRCF